MKEMLKQRHLAPHWGIKNQIAAEPYDLMTIDTTPEIFVTGHTHGHCLEQYRGAQMVVLALHTWQHRLHFKRWLDLNPNYSFSC